MLSKRSYLVPALYQWILDNGWTPHIVVDANQPGVKVPQPYVKDGQIVLNVAPGAVQGLIMNRDSLQFSARFGGTPIQITVPMAAIMAIYARENGDGMIIPPEPPSPPDGGPGKGKAPEPKIEPDPNQPKGRPKLKVVK